MSLVEPPEESIETGRIEVSIFIDEDGEQQVDCDYEGLTPHAVIGYFLVLSDHYREVLKRMWETEDEWEDEE